MKLQPLEDVLSASYEDPSQAAGHAQMREASFGVLGPQFLKLPSCGASEAAPVPTVGPAKPSHRFVPHPARHGFPVSLLRPFSDARAVAQRLEAIHHRVGVIPAVGNDVLNASLNPSLHHRLVGLLQGLGQRRRVPLVGSVDLRGHDHSARKVPLRSRPCRPAASSRPSSS